MNVKIDPLFDQRVADWLEADPDRAPAQVLATVLAAAPSIPQRRAGPAWREWARPLQLVAAAVVIAVAAASGFFVLRSIGLFGPTPQPSPTGVTFPPPTETFSSTINGISIGYPLGQQVHGASQPVPWAVQHTWSPTDPWVDNFLDTVGTGLINVVALPIPVGATPDKWVADELAASLLTTSSFPACGKTMSTERVTVDGVSGVIDTHCSVSDLTAIVTTGGIAYVIDLRADPPDKAWFLRLLATVKLHPQAVVRAPAAWSTKLVPFTSTTYGYSITYPSDWKVRPGTGTLLASVYPLDSSAGVDYFSATAPNVSDPGLVVAAPAVDAATTTASWAADIAQLQASTAGCGPADAVEDMSIGGETGRLQTWNSCPAYLLWAGVVRGGRGYDVEWIDRYAVGSLFQQTADKAMFKRIVASLTFAAGPAASAGPSASP